jgi:hypothetical protein
MADKRVSQIADWRAVRTGAITAGIVALGAALFAADAAVWRIVGAAGAAVGLGVTAFLFARATNRRLLALDKRIDGDGGLGATIDLIGARTHAIEHRLAELEAREILNDYCEAPYAALTMGGEQLWGEALRILSGAIMSGWRVGPDEPGHVDPGVRLYPPPSSGSKAVFVLLLPLSFERLDAAATYLRGHGVPLARVSAQELPR